MGIYLSFDVMEEIMLRLPPKSLLKCKCINKEYHHHINRLINNPHFVAKHLQYTKANVPHSTCLVIYHSNNSGSQCSFLTRFSDNGDEEGNVNCVTKNLDFSAQFSDSSKNSMLIKAYHCDVAICIDANFGCVTLFNPELQKSMAIVAPSYIQTRRPEYTKRALGFGFDSTSNAYKLVRILSGKQHIFTAEICIVSELINNHEYSWREVSISIQNLENYNVRIYNHVYCKGACYWLVGTSMVLSFNVSIESFCSIPLPDDFPSNFENYDSISLHVWNDSIFFFWCPQPRGFPNPIRMWVMDGNCDGGVGEGYSSFSWRKCPNISPGSEKVSSVLAFWKNDELFMHAKDGKIVSYNLHAKKIRNLRVPGVEECESVRSLLCRIS